MSWDALLDLLAIGGNDVHVWGAYALALALVLVEIILVFARRRSVFGYLGWRARGSGTPRSAA